MRPIPSNARVHILSYHLPSPSLPQTRAHERTQTCMDYRSSPKDLRPMTEMRLRSPRQSRSRDRKVGDN